MNEKMDCDHALRSSRSILDLAKSVHESTESLKRPDPVAESSAQIESSEPQPNPPAEGPIPIPKKEPKQP